MACTLITLIIVKVTIYLSVGKANDDFVLEISCKTHGKWKLIMSGNHDIAGLFVSLVVYMHVVMSMVVLLNFYQYRMKITYSSTSDRVATGQGKVREIQGQGKSGNFGIGQGNCEMVWKVRVI